MTTDVPQPPKRPWTKGKHEDHEVAHLTVEICTDSLQRVYSVVRPSEKEDEDLLRVWKSGGLEQTAFSLLVEAVRSEALLEMLIFRTHHPDLFKRLQEAEGDERDALLTDLAKRLEMQMALVIKRMEKDAIEEALRIVSE